MCACKFTFLFILTCFVLTEYLAVQAEEERESSEGEEEEDGNEEENAL